MAPANLACLVVDSFDDSLTPKAVVGASPAVVSISRLGEVDAPAWVGIDDEQACPGIKARGAVVGHAALVGCDEASVRRGFFGRVGNRPAVFVDAESPVCG